MLQPPTRFCILHAYVLTCLQDSWPGIVIKGFELETLGQCSDWATVGGTLEFPGQLIALLLVAHWLERWCASLATQVQMLACPIQRQLLQGET